jgi:hypothetical protein
MPKELVQPFQQQAARTQKEIIAMGAVATMAIKGYFYQL